MESPAVSGRSKSGGAATVAPPFKATRSVKTQQF